MAQPLEQERATFDREREHLEKEHHGKFVLIHGSEVVDTFDTFEAAADEGLRQFEPGTFLIRRVGAERDSLPVSVVYGLSSARP